MDLREGQGMPWHCFHPSSPAPAPGLDVHHRHHVEVVENLIEPDLRLRRIPVDRGRGINGGQPAVGGGGKFPKVDRRGIDNGRRFLGRWRRARARPTRAVLLG